MPKDKIENGRRCFGGVVPEACGEPLRAPSATAAKAAARTRGTPYGVPFDIVVLICMAAWQCDANAPLLAAINHKFKAASAEAATNVTTIDVPGANVTNNNLSLKSAQRYVHPYTTPATAPHTTPPHTALSENNVGRGRGKEGELEPRAP